MLCFVCSIAVLTTGLLNTECDLSGRAGLQYSVLLVQRIERLEQTLTCSVCRLFPTEPMECVQCGSLSCETCTRQMSDPQNNMGFNCPTCLSTLPFREAKAVRLMILNAVFKCSDCGRDVATGDRELHASVLNDGPESAPSVCSRRETSQKRRNTCRFTVADPHVLRPVHREDCEYVHLLITVVKFVSVRSISHATRSLPINSSYCFYREPQPVIRGCRSSSRR